MKTKHLFYMLFFVVLAVGGLSCKNDIDENLVPIVPVNVRVNMELPAYFDLRFPGNYVYINDRGHKGITVIHGFDGEFYATDRTCPYEPFEECSRVELGSDFTFRCGSRVNGVFQKCCSSTFQYDGILTNGPATFDLRRYRVFKSGNILDITN